MYPIRAGGEPYLGARFAASLFTPASPEPVVSPTRLCSPASHQQRRTSRAARSDSHAQSTMCAMPLTLSVWHDKTAERVHDAATSALLARPRPPAGRRQPERIVPMIFIEY